jgi:hypothetical protein
MGKKRWQVFCQVPFCLTFRLLLMLFNQLSSIPLSQVGPYAIFLLALAVPYHFPDAYC